MTHICHNITIITILLI